MSKMRTKIVGLAGLGLVTVGAALTSLSPALGASMVEYALLL